MSAFDSLTAFFRDESWRPVLRRYQRKIYRRKTWASSTGRVPFEEKHATSFPSERADSGIAIDAYETEPKQPLLDAVTDEIKPQLYSALQIVSRGTYGLSNSCPEPEFLGEGEVMIRNCAAGLNPIDWKSVDYNFCLPSFPWVTGREMAGVVHRVAPGVTRFRPGDRVWTSTYYRDIRAGCFQDLVVVPEHTVLSISGDLSYEAAACLGVGGLTAAMTLWRWLRVPRASECQILPVKSGSERECLLVWGGSTITGQFAIQIAVQSGLEVIAVASSKTEALVRALGAHVITRDGKTNAEVVESIRSVAGDRITRGLDLVGSSTAPFSLQCLSTTRPCIFAPLAMMKTQEVRENVEVVTVEMKQFVLDKTTRAYAEDLNILVGNGSLKLPEIDVLAGGLTAVQEGLERVKLGDMGGKKIVVSWS